MAETNQAETAGSATLKVVVVSPEATLLDDVADFVALPLFDGEVGIAPNHTPMIGRLGYGELRIRRGGVTTRYYVDGGFVQVADNVVSVLTSRAVPAAQLDPAVVAEQLEAARTRPANSPESFALRDKAQAQTRAQLRVATKK